MAQRLAATRTPLWTPALGNAPRENPLCPPVRIGGALRSTSSPDDVQRGVPDAAVAVARTALGGRAAEKWTERSRATTWDDRWCGSTGRWTTATRSTALSDERKSCLYPTPPPPNSLSLSGQARPLSQHHQTPVQLRSSRAEVCGLPASTGVAVAKSTDKVCPDAVYEAPEYLVVGFLQGSVRCGRLRRQHKSQGHSLCRSCQCVAELVLSVRVAGFPGQSLVGSTRRRH